MIIKRIRNPAKNPVTSVATVIDRIEFRLGTGQKSIIKSFRLGTGTKRNLKAYRIGTGEKLYQLTKPASASMTGSNGNITINWTLQANRHNVDSYDIFYSTSSNPPTGATNPTTTRSGETTTTTGAINVADNNTFFAWVRSKNNDGTVTDWVVGGSANSGILSVTLTLEVNVFDNSFTATPPIVNKSAPPGSPKESFETNNITFFAIQSVDIEVDLTSVPNNFEMFVTKNSGVGSFNIPLSTWITVQTFTVFNFTANGTFSLRARKSITVNDTVAFDSFEI